MLQLEPPRPNVFLHADAYRELLNARPASHGLDIPRVGSRAIQDRIRSLLDDGRSVVLHGPGGIGKTRLVLDLATEASPDEQWRFLDELSPFRADALGELSGGSELVVVIDNAHRRRDLTDVLSLARATKASTEGAVRGTSKPR